MHLLVDVMCGGIVAYCRVCGHDTVYAGDCGLEADADLVDAACEGDRTLVTRDVALAERVERRGGRVILLESREVEPQLEALLRSGVELTPSTEPRVCGRCNGCLESVPDGDQTPSYAPDTTEFDVWRCTDCGQHFWKGSHWERISRTLERVRSSVEPSERCS